jgi:hypothetical protein
LRLEVTLLLKVTKLSALFELLQLRRRGRERPCRVRVLGKIGGGMEDRYRIFPSALLIVEGAGE